MLSYHLRSFTYTTVDRGGKHTISILGNGAVFEIPDIADLADHEAEANEADRGDDHDRKTVNNKRLFYKPIQS